MSGETTSSEWGETTKGTLEPGESVTIDGCVKGAHHWDAQYGGYLDCHYDYWGTTPLPPKVYINTTDEPKTIDVFWFKWSDYFDPEWNARGQADWDALVDRVLANKVA